MNIIYSPGYKKENTLYIAIHNAGGLGNNPMASTLHLTHGQVDMAHKERFNMCSSLGWWGGYNFYIEQDGTTIQFRAIGEETAAQRRFNFNGVAISICLAGNFTKGVDVPTEQQKQALFDLTLELPMARIVPHRFLQSGTECFGSGLPNNFFELMPIKKLQERLTLMQKLLVLLQTIRAMQNKLRGASLPCNQIDTRG